MYSTIPSGPDAPPPDVFDGARLRNVHWTGHYISDPTLAFTNGELRPRACSVSKTKTINVVRPWTIGPYQSYALAKVWEGTARLPNQQEMWRQYNDTRWSHFRGLFGTSGAQGRYPSHQSWSCTNLGMNVAIHRQYVTWINNESLEHGGPLVDNWPVKCVSFLGLHPTSKDLTKLHRNREIFSYYANKEWEFVCVISHSSMTCCADRPPGICQHEQFHAI